MNRIIIACLWLIITCSWLVSAFSVGPVDFTWWDAQDPYYQMESQNLNTMNSYFVPSAITPIWSDGWVDLADYVTVARDTQDPSYILTNADARSNAPSVIHYMSSYNGVWIQLVVFLLLCFSLQKFPNSKISQSFGLLFDYIDDFFDDILWNVPLWIKKFVITLFFVILISNFLWIINDVLRFIFPWLLRNVTTPTAELEFNLGLAIVSTVVILYTQSKSLWWFGNLIKDYIPITGKGLMPENKFADIVISLFVWLLDIIGIFARIISLSLRLFGNMSAWSILLNVTFLGLGLVTIWFLNTNLALWIPLIVYLQWMLSAVIQAFVFSLIVAIWLRMAYEST